MRQQKMLKLYNSNLFSSFMEKVMQSGSLMINAVNRRLNCCSCLKGFYELPLDKLRFLLTHNKFSGTIKKTLLQINSIKLSVITTFTQPPETANIMEINFHP